MLVLKRKKYFLKIAEVYFHDQETTSSSLSDVDVVMYVQASSADAGAKKFHTLQIDLSLDEETLFQELGKHNRYKIKRAEKQDQLDCVFLRSPTLLQIEEFASFYDLFAATKNLPGCNRQKLCAAKELDSVTITYVRDKDGQNLCGHAYVCDQARARLLYSASLFRHSADSAYRAVVGRAHRYLHWQDITRFKDLGYLIYDFGGLSLEESQEDTKNIDDFKRGFGGQVVTEFNYFLPKTALGKMVVRFLGKR